MHMKKRNALLVILFSIITFGIYFVYWFYVTAKYMNEISKKGIIPWLWTVSLIVPIWNLITYWRFSKLAEELTDKKANALACFLFFIFFFPIPLYLIQDGLNNKFNDGVVKPAETPKVEVKSEEFKVPAVKSSKAEEEGPELY